jgi:hypothetical protein
MLNDSMVHEHSTTAQPPYAAGANPQADPGRRFERLRVPGPWRRHFLNRLLPSHSSRHGAPQE